MASVDTQKASLNEMRREGQQVDGAAGGGDFARKTGSGKEAERKAICFFPWIADPLPSAVLFFFSF